MQQTLFFAEGGILTTSKKRAFAHEVLQDLDNSQEAAMEQPTKKMKLTCDYSVSALPFTTVSLHASNSWQSADGSLFEKLDAMMEAEQAYFSVEPSLRLQSGITPRMRMILLDWLSEICAEYALHRETLQLAINYVDRFLQKHPNLPKHVLQLVGAGSLMVASKVEEYLELTPQCLSMLTDHTYTPEEICQFEALLISTLNWQLLPPSPLAFLNTYSDILSSDLASPRVLQLIDLAMLTPGPVRPSRLSAAALAFDRKDASVIAQLTKIPVAEIKSSVSWIKKHCLSKNIPEWIQEPRHIQTRYPAEALNSPPEQDSNFHPFDETLH